MLQYFLSILNDIKTLSECVKIPDKSINVEDRFIATSSWDSDGHCRRIRDSDVEEYLGHSISYYAVENLFSDFSKTIKLELHEEKRPKK